jgi:hypothetical protein
VVPGKSPSASSRPTKSPRPPRTVDASWWLYTDREPPLSGSDRPEDYLGNRWVPTPPFAHDPVLANLPQLKEVQILLAAGLRNPVRVDRLVEPILVAHEALGPAQEKAIRLAEADVAAGRTPVCPWWLAVKQRAVSQALTRMLSQLRLRAHDAGAFYERFAAQGREHIASMRLTAELVENARGTALEPGAQELHAETTCLAHAFTSHLIALLRLGQ